MNAVSSASVVIKLAETDGGFNFGDDVCDIAPNNGTDLDLTIPLFPCSVTGDITGNCNESITASGNGQGDGNADLRFRVEVESAGVRSRAHRPLHARTAVAATRRRRDDHRRVARRQRASR